MMRQHNMFDIERNMYNIHVPEMEQLYRDAGVHIKFGAQAYAVKGAKTEYILLEDLSPRGFKNLNRVEGLDQVHTEAALQKLAMWHAASAVRVATKGAYPDQLMVGFYKEENKMMMAEINKQMAANFLNSCATYEGSEEYLEQVVNIVYRLSIYPIIFIFLHSELYSPRSPMKSLKAPNSIPTSSMH